ncbi:ATPase family AAA domain-containing protein 5 [Nibea albiflora]|uniref:ATPase family AAA domain-containing protein 5 n=1 Tax=Nibea albiflora TaxID=240163 RepID=A0ACB7FL65_NIBAL|nr:ATPase family AAA domain-containing protein 5 [Nibea albiflora]
MSNRLKLKKKPRNPEQSPEPSCLCLPPAGFSEALQQQRETKHVKTAPIFLHAAQHGNRPALPPQLQPTEGCRGRLPAAALHGCLEEIQTTSSPAFPVRAVFSSLQEKTAENSLNQSSELQKEKKKRESSERVSKRRRSEGAVGTGQCDESALRVEERIDLTADRCNKLSHTLRLRQQNSSFQDVLWTDKYSPQHSREVVGNSASVNKLQSWLKKWKERADRDDQRQMEERKQEESSSDSWDCGDFQGEAGPQDDREEPLCNTMLLTGPPGVGKTAVVYACSQELGFKVFEVNCSSLRCGRHVLSQLKEATQSHLVEVPGRDPLRPAYFNNYNIKSSATKSETVPGQTSKKRAAQNSARSGRKGKARPATVTLANYFKTKAKADQFHFGAPSPSEKPDGTTWSSSSPQSKKTATSLILFEEVDVIFDEDVGFLAAIKTFMTTTRRPVVLTTNDPSFRERFSCSLEEMIFKPPSALVALAENVRLELDDVSALLRLTGGDVRRCLLQLQLWVHSGGGRPEERSVTEGGARVDLQLPGCTASMLGLHSVTQNQLKDLLKCQFWSEPDMVGLLRLLAESWRRGVPLLYSNLELLLPIGAKGTSVLHLDTGTCPGLQSEQIQQLYGSVSPKVSVDDSKPVRKVSRLSRRRYMTTSDTSTSGSRDKTKRNAAKVTSDCLDALTDFFELMSYLDATMPPAEPFVSGSCRPEAFVWTGAEIKDGLLDEMSEEEEEGGSCSQERLLDIQAAVEGLGCHRCLWRVSEVWTDAQKYRQDLGDVRWGRLVERLTLPASSKTQSLSFSLHPLCAPSVSQRRFELSRSVLSSDSFSLLGNRRAVAVDYTPVLRYVCRLQRQRRQKEEPVRCLNYLRGSGLSKSTLRLLAEDFS